MFFKRDNAVEKRQKPSPSLQTLDELLHVRKRHGDIVKSYLSFEN